MSKVDEALTRFENAKRNLDQVMDELTAPEVPPAEARQLGWVPFTQYLRPDGQRRAGGFVRSPEIAEQAAKWLAEGGTFAAEVLPGGSVALTAEFTPPDGEGIDAAILIVPNGPGIGEAVDKLVMRAVEKLPGLRFSGD